MAMHSEVPGFSYLEPRRHIPHITDLDGREADTLGRTIAFASAALSKAASAELVYVNVFGGGIPHLHIHLAPHRQGDALSDRIIRGEVAVKHLPSGGTELVSKDFPAVSERRLRAIAARTRRLLATK
jgi:diadenosine tetraphosphate (Ap4A) HIT family hydrolase